MYRSKIPYDFVVDTSSPIPERALNGGLFTGEPFQKDAEWGNFPSVPASAIQNHVNLKSANPPNMALYHMQVGYRPGNNTDPVMPGIVNMKYGAEYSPYKLQCINACNKYNNFVVETPYACSKDGGQFKVIRIP